MEQREQVLHVVRWVTRGGGLDRRKIKFGPGPHERILVDIRIASIGFVEFECRE